MLEQRCPRGCCGIKFCPLVVGFGRTIHSFQGQQAGPGNAIESIICNPGERSFEGLNPGTLTTCITRATTIGDDGNNNSAIYFTGSGFFRDRISLMSYRTNGQKYAKVILRDKFVDYIQKMIIENKELYDEIFNREQMNINEWYTKQNFSVQRLDEIIIYNNKHIK